MIPTSCSSRGGWPAQWQERFRAPHAGQTLINVRQQAWVVTQVRHARVELVPQDYFYQGLTDETLNLSLEQFWDFCRCNGIVPPLIR